MNEKRKTMFKHILLCFIPVRVINARRTIYHRVKATLYLTCAIQNPILFRKKIKKCRSNQSINMMNNIFLSIILWIETIVVFAFCNDGNQGAVCINARCRTQTNRAIFLTSNTIIDNMLRYSNLYNFVNFYWIKKRFSRTC